MGSLNAATKYSSSFCTAGSNRDRTFRLFDFKKRADRGRLPSSTTRHHLASDKVEEARLRSVLDQLEGCKEGALRRYDLNAIKVLVDAFHCASTERIILILLSDCGKYLGCEVLTSGHISRTNGRFRSVIEPLIRRGAHSFFLAHNHPSGSAIPSHSDIRVTRQLGQLSVALDICFDDHFIVAGRVAYSMRVAGFL